MEYRIEKFNLSRKEIVQYGRNTHASTTPNPSFTPLCLLPFASATNRSNSFNPATTSLSLRISSNSRRALSSTPCIIWLCTEAKIWGQCRAGVGKQALNLDKETVDSVLVRAEEKRAENFVARGPGVRGIGGGGGGEGVRSWFEDIGRR